MKRVKKYDYTKLGEQAAQIVGNVLLKCISEANDSLVVSIYQPLERASIYTGIPISKVREIRDMKDSDFIGNDTVLVPLAKRFRPKLEMDEINRNTVQKVIQDFYITTNIVPTCNDLLERIEIAIYFQWGMKSLMYILKQMGYELRRYRKQKHVHVIEKPSVVYARSNYLRKIHEHRVNERSIIYIDEVWFDDDMSYKKFWRIQAKEEMLMKWPPSKLILFNAISKTGILENTQYIYKYQMFDGSKNGKFNSIFENWVINKLIPNLPENSVIVMDNSSYHNVPINNIPKPTKYSSKKAMIQWLTGNNILFAHSMRKDELYRLIRSNRSIGKAYKIDKIIQSHGHEVLRLPPFVDNLTPMEHLWKNIIRLLESSDSSTTLEKLEEIVPFILNAFGKVIFLEYDEIIRKVERQYWEIDGIMEKILDNFDSDTELV